jgi:ribosomal protein L11 methyltransferase
MHDKAGELFELRLQCLQDDVEEISDALDALDALSVSVEDADAHTDAEQPLFGEPGMPATQQAWLHSRLVALFTTRVLADEALDILQAQDFFARCRGVAIQALPEQDWVRLTQSQFEPVQVTPEFWIVPTWHEPPAQARVVIRLDPGLAFGTGTHPTTQMCLRWIATAGALAGAAVLDYGCGSGILALGAAKYGAAQVVAVDIDPAAVEATVINAQANHVDVVAGLPEQAGAGYPVVLANILATPLKVLAPLLVAKVAAGGQLVLAGILARQAEELRDAYSAFCALQVADEQDGWVLMTARLPTA